MSDRPPAVPTSGGIVLDDPLPTSPPGDDPAEVIDDAGATGVDDGSNGAGGVMGSAGGPSGGAVPLADELARVTGLLLVVLLPIHLLTVLLVDPTDVEALLERWRNRWWLLADWGFLTVGVVHCVLSLRARVLALGSTGPGAGADRPETDGVPATDDHFGRVAFGLLVTIAGVLYLAASWATLRLV